MQQELIFVPSCSLQTGCWGTNDLYEEDQFLFLPLCAAELMSLRG